MSRHLTELLAKRAAPEAVLGNLLVDNSTGVLAAESMLRECKDYGVTLKDYLTLAIDPTKSENANRYRVGEGVYLDGYEAALMHLGLPAHNNFQQGIVLQAAADQFAKYPGTRAMFPEVLDSMLRWTNRQDQIESVDPMLAQSRTINSVEMVTTVVDDDSADRKSYTIAEGGRIPVRSIRTTEQAVKMFKHGSGYELTYEFARRASLDVQTPFAARVARELETSKVSAATSVLLNGDGTNGAATAVTITSLGGVVVGTTPLSGQYKTLAKWMVQRAKAGAPIDTILGNLDMYLELLFMFTPTVNGTSVMEALSAKGAPSVNLNIPLLNSSAKFVLSSSMPANRLLGYTRAETLEELKEAGSTLEESERAIRNQTMTTVKTETTGYKLAMGDTRSLLNLEA